MELDINRYARQISLPEISIDGQEKISSSHILVVGAGGIGSAVLLYLASSGVGKITIIDDDIVSKSNLHRQILFSDSDIGYNKASKSCEFLKSRYPSQEFIAIDRFLDTQMAIELINDVDLIIDGTDSFLSKYILSDLITQYNIPLIIGAVVGFNGYVAGFNDVHTYRDIFPLPPKQSPNCNEVGVLPSVVAQISMQIVTEAIKIIVGIENNIIGTLISYNGIKSEYSKIDFSNNKSNFPRLPQIICLSNSDISIYKDYYFIDVREPHEIIESPYNISYINIPIGSFLNDLTLPFLDKDIVFICKTSRRSQMALLHYALSNKHKHNKLYFYRLGCIS